jgi:hypothetical protein
MALSPPDSDPPPSFAADVPPGKPIRVARKIRGKKRSNIFLNNRGFPDHSHKFDVILHNTMGGPILQKRKHPAPPLDAIDPRFKATYNKAHHGERLRTELNLSHLDPPVRNQVYKLLQKYWSVFDD